MSLTKFAVLYCVVFNACKSSKLPEEESSSLSASDHSKVSSFLDPTQANQGSAIQFCHREDIDFWVGNKQYPLLDNMYLMMLLSKYAYWDVSRALEKYERMNIFPTDILMNAKINGKKVILSDFLMLGKKNAGNELYMMLKNKMDHRDTDLDARLKALSRIWKDYFEDMGFSDIKTYWAGYENGGGVYRFESLPKLIQYLVNSSERKRYPDVREMKDIVTKNPESFNAGLEFLIDFVRNNERLKRVVIAQSSYKGDNIQDYKIAGDRRLILGTDGSLADGDAELGSTQFNVFEDKNYTFLIFKGSKEINDWFANAKVLLRPYKEMEDFLGEKDIYVHRGFKRAVLSEERSIFLALEGARQKGKPIWISGHSLGGALANVFGGLMLAKNHALEKKGEPLYNLRAIYSFGSPKVGNRNFVTAFNGLAKVQKVGAFQIRTEADGVAKAPLPGYEKNGQPVILDGEGQSARVTIPLEDKTVKSLLEAFNRHFLSKAL